MTLAPRQSVELPSGPATYVSAGARDAEPVLLLHGGGLDCATLSWRYLLPVLAADHRVIAPNWPGYAGTAAFRRPYQIGDLGHWLLGFMKHLDIARASLVGVSMGGGIALWTALNHPDRVRALVPVASYGLASKAPHHLLTFLLTRLPVNTLLYAAMRRSPGLLRQALHALFADPAKVTPELIFEVETVLRDAGAGAAFTHFQRGEMTRTGLRTSFASALRRIDQPTLFIHGSEDTLVPLSAIECAADTMPSARVEVMAAGHWPMRECPEAFNAHVASFLRRVP